MGLPQSLESLFWDCDFASLDMSKNRGFVIRRVLSEGGLNAIRWLRKNTGDAELRDWLLSKSGRGLSPQRLRFWQVILGLPKEQVDEWVARARASTWHKRTAA